MKKITPMNPCTGKPLQPMECTAVDGIPDKVQQSRRAQKKWAVMPYQERCKLIISASYILNERLDHLAELITLEMGKPPNQAKQEVQAYLSRIGNMIEIMGKALMPEEIQDEEDEGRQTAVHYVPYGVAALITPWNVPIGIPLKMIVSALLAGNTVLFKPSEITTQSGIAIANVFNKVLPVNVLQTIVGSESQGAALTTADVDFIGFVGSRKVGKTIMRAASHRISRFILELGGKDPMIIGKGADLDAAADFAVRMSFLNSGQLCCSVERIYVEREVEEAFLEKVIERTEKVLVGSESKDRFSIGPMSSEKQMNYVLKQVNQAIEDGACLIKGGTQVDRPGYYIEPTVLTCVSDDSSIMQEETFGPVICVRAVDSVDEAIEISNSSRYGLTASLWMGDIKDAQKKALSIESGRVGLNGPADAVNAPWYGTKESGYGSTGGGGVTGMRSYLQPRSIIVTE